MATIGRTGLTPEKKKELWRRWKNGESLSDIGRAIECHAGSVHCVLSAHGGIAPTQRRRSKWSLTHSEREDISRGLACGLSLRNISDRLDRAPSTISREIERNGGAHAYRAEKADHSAWERSRRPKKCALALNFRLRKIVAKKLQLDWAPQQIAGWLKLQFPDEPALHISHETIYKTLFVQARGALKRELISHLRSRRTMRRGKTATTAGQTRGQIIDAVSIRERPAEIEDRAIPGHWEGDLVSGARNTHIATLVERSSRYTLLVKLAGKDTKSVVSALTKAVKKLPQSLKKTLTWDRGLELASHKKFSVATNIQVFFCDPQSPWQRGTNENTNGLLRQYFPDGTDLSQFSQRDLNAVAARLNQRPRKTLNYRTPAATLQELLH